MLLKGTRFVAIMLAALTLGLGFCHLMQLPSRLGWDQYLWVGSTVQGGLYAAFGSVGALISIAAIVVLFILAYFVREHGRPDSLSRLPRPFCLLRRSCCGTPLAADTAARTLDLDLDIGPHHADIVSGHDLVNRIA